MRQSIECNRIVTKNPLVNRVFSIQWTRINSSQQMIQLTNGTNAHCTRSRFWNRLTNHHLTCVPHYSDDLNLSNRNSFGFKCVSRCGDVSNLRFTSLIKVRIFFSKHTNQRYIWSCYFHQTCGVFASFMLQNVLRSMLLCSNYSIKHNKSGIVNAFVCKKTLQPENDCSTKHTIAHSAHSQQWRELLHTT